MKRYEPKTLEEIAKELGVTRERVRQIEAAALEKCRKRLIKMGVTAEDIQDPETGIRLLLG